MNEIQTTSLGRGGHEVPVRVPASARGPWRGDLRPTVSPWRMLKRGVLSARPLCDMRVATEAGPTDRREQRIMCPAFAAVPITSLICPKATVNRAAFRRSAAYLPPRVLGEPSPLQRTTAFSLTLPPERLAAEPAWPHYRPPQSERSWDLSPMSGTGEANRYLVL